MILTEKDICQVEDQIHGPHGDQVLKNVDVVIRDLVWYDIADQVHIQLIFRLRGQILDVFYDFNETRY
jgi:hypothetical protein